MIETTINIAPTAGTIVNLWSPGAEINNTVLLAMLAVNQGLEDVPIDRISATLNVREDD